MKRVHFYLIISSIALTAVAAFFGAAFTTSNFACIMLSGIAGSIISTVMTNWMVAKRLEHLPITSIIHALEDRTKFARKDQNIRLEFRLEGEEVVVNVEHRFQLINPSLFSKRRLVSIFTDAPQWSEEAANCGFTLVRDSGGTLQGDELKQYVRRDNSKQCFERYYDLPPGDSIEFCFHMIERYRLRDRMVWTIQDLSKDLRLILLNRTGIAKPFEIKIHHHKEGEIMKQVRTETILQDGREETVVEFDSEILPYQGFEITWNFRSENSGRVEPEAG